MLVIRGIVTVVVITMLAAFGGGLIAVALNWLAPDYYPGVFRSMNHPFGDAPQIGVGTGVIQGQVVGLLVGGVVVLALAWFGQLSWAACFRGVGILFGCAALAALLGGLVGLAIGVQAPGYYRSLVRGGRLPDFNPIDVGIGLGTSQGAMVGMLCGGLIIAILAWRQARHLKPALSETEPYPAGTEDFNFRLPRKNF